MVFSFYTMVMFVFALVLASFLPITAFAIDYRPLVDLPIVGSGAQSISGYLISIFRLLIGVAGVLAVGRMVICGFQAIISISPSGREEASQCVLGAVTGLLLALSAWLILYQVNPVLIRGELTLPVTGTLPGGGTPPGLGGGTPAQCDMRNLCQGESSGPSCSGSNSQCAQYSAYANEFASGRVSANLIREIMAQESSCNISAGSSVGACGLMQLLPSTANQHKRACGIPSYTSITCDWLRDPVNARLSICLASQELSALSRGARVFQAQAVLPRVDVMVGGRCHDGNVLMMIKRNKDVTLDSWRHVPM